MKPPLVNIIILNWNGSKDTSELLDSLYKITYDNCKIIIVDNNSKPDDIETLMKNHGNKVHIIQCRENCGFSGGNNIGIQYALDKNADFILLLNNDTIVEKNFLEPLIEKFLMTKNLGIVGPKIKYYHFPDRIWSMGGTISKIRSSGFALSDKLETTVTNADKEVSFISGCCMLVKNEVFNSIGLFDENFFLYLEDTDFCYRLKNAGFKIFVVPESIIYHKVGQSTIKNMKILPLYYTTRNRLYFAKKNFRNNYYLSVIYLFLVMMIKGITWLFQGRNKNIQAVVLAFKDFFAGRMGRTQHEKYFG